MLKRVGIGLLVLLILGIVYAGSFFLLVVTSTIKLVYLPHRPMINVSVENRSEPTW